MFSLFYGLWKYLFQRDEYYVLILGLDNAGKTTFLEQTKMTLNPNYKGANLSKISCTVGLNLGKIQSLGVTLNFWDLGGQSELQCLWDKVGGGADTWSDSDCPALVSPSQFAFAVLRRVAWHHLHRRLVRSRKNRRLEKCVWYDHTNS